MEQKNLVKDKGKFLRNFINIGTKKGKSECSEKIIFKSLSLCKIKYKRMKPLGLYYELIDTHKPLLRLLKVRKSGRVHELGIPVSQDKSSKVAMSWVYSGEGKGSVSRLFNEMSRLNESQYQSVLVKKRDDLYRVAVKNRVRLKLLTKVL